MEEKKQAIVDPITSEFQPFPQDPPAPKIPLRRAVTVKKKKNKQVLVSKTKLDLFLEEYLANNGNGTEAALKVFNCKSRHVAGQMASLYLKQAQSLGKIILEKKGMAYGDLVDMAKKRMEMDKSPDFVALWDRMMKIGGYEDFMAKGPVTKATVNVMTVQKGLLDEYVDGEYVEDDKE